MTGHRKPEPAAYLSVCDALGVPPDRCVFIGDGGSHELSGAAALGMRVMRFIPPVGEAGESIDADADWAGPAIADLMEVPRRLS